MFEHITYGMGLMFLVGYGFLVALKFKRTEISKGGDNYRVDKYLTPTPRNFIVHLLGGFACLMLIHDLGELILPYVLKVFGVNFEGSVEGRFLYVFSILSGGRGGYFLTWAFEKIRKKQNLNDPNIIHVHGPDCGHDLNNDDYK